MLARGRHVALYRSLSLPTASLDELKEAVIVAAAAEEVWLGAANPESVLHTNLKTGLKSNPDQNKDSEGNVNGEEKSVRCVGRPRRVRLKGVDLDHASYVMKFTSHTHLVLPTKAGWLVGWDMRTGERAGGKPTFLRPSFIHSSSSCLPTHRHWFSFLMMG